MARQEKGLVSVDLSGDRSTTARCVRPHTSATAEDHHRRGARKAESLDARQTGCARPGGAWHLLVTNTAWPPSRPQPVVMGRYGAEADCQAALLKTYGPSLVLVEQHARNGVAHAHVHRAPGRLRWASGAGHHRSVSAAWCARDDEGAGP
jgi:hypothetical protein